MARLKRSSWTKERIKDMFDMHRSERRGAVVLLTVLVLLIGWVGYEQWWRDPRVHDLSRERAMLASWLEQRARSSVDTSAQRLFPFDPNVIGREEWRALGLSEKQIDGVQRYQAKGGRFRTKKDLGRMYSIRPEQFATLSPFILLPDSFTKKHYHNRDIEPRGNEREHFAERWPTIQEREPYQPKLAPSVEINSADTTDLIALPGIGPAFARSIIKFRDALGGFHSLDQLSEVYILKDKPEAVLKLKQVLIIDTLAIRRIPINSCTVEELAAHPYARWKVAKPLIAYRGQHGRFLQVEEIRHCAAVNVEVFLKLAPYLSVE